MGLSSIIGIVQFGLLGAFLSAGGEFPGLEAYGGNIAGFLITGAVGSSMLLLMMGVAKETIQGEQRTGTLEIVAVSTVGVESLIGARLVVNLLSTIVSSGILTAVIFVAFDIQAELNVIALSISLLAGTVLMSSIGLCAAGYVLNSKSGEPFTWLITTVMGLFSGVMFPVEIFPPWLANVANLLPTTVVMRALRTATMSGYTVTHTVIQLVPAFIAIVVVLPLGIYMYRWGMNESRRKGTIGNY